MPYTHAPSSHLRNASQDCYTPFQLASMKHNNFQSMEAILDKLVQTYDENKKHKVFNKTFDFDQFRKEVDKEQNF